MVNNYSVVQTDEDGEMLLSVLPSKWTTPDGSGKSGDLGYWPINYKGYRLLEKAKANPEIPADIQLLKAIPCKIKRTGFAKYAEARRALKDMECTPETDDYEDQQPKLIVKNTAKLFAQIQAQKETVVLGDPDIAASAMDVADQISESQLELNAMTKATELLGRRGGCSQEFASSAEDHAASGVLTVDAFNGTMNAVFAELKAVREENSSLKALLCQLNAKVDYIGSASTLNSSDRESALKLKKAPFAPVQTEEDLKVLEEKCREDEFVKTMVKSVGRIMGKNQCVGDGGTVCLNVVDQLFTREFLTNCSWTGVSRSKDVDNSIPKIAFHKFERVLNLFYQIIAYSDPTYSQEKCKSFLHYCLKNAKQRLEHKHVKKSSARKRIRISNDASKSEDEEWAEEGNEDEAARKTVVFEGFV